MTGGGDTVSRAGGPGGAPWVTGRAGGRVRWIPLLLVLVATVVRVWDLDLKPAHFDEGVNGWFVDRMAEDGYYAYDPTNYHGPLHFYLLHASQTLLGRNLWALRLPTVVAGVLLVLALWGMRRFLPRAGCLWAAAFAAVSPALTFTSRYAIHETWMALFLVTGTYGALGLLAGGRRKDLWITALSVSGLVLTKETYFIHIGTAVIALGCLRALERISPSVGPHPPRGAGGGWTGRDVALAALVSGGLVVFFYSGTFYQWDGVAGLVETHTAWFQTGVGGSGHDKPFHYWLELMARHEWGAALGLLSLPVLLWPSGRSERFVGIYAFGILLAFSIIPYKTPWCLVSIVPHFLMVAGAHLDRLARLDARCRWLAAGVGAVVWGHGLVESLRLNFREYTNPAHPYVYVQTYEEIERLTGPLLELAARDPTAYHLRGELLLDSYYPLPWILGEFTRLAYRAPDSMDAVADADFVVIPRDRAGDVEKLIGFEAIVRDFRLREAQSECRVYFRADRFRAVFAGRRPEFTPGSRARAETVR